MSYTLLIYLIHLTHATLIYLTTHVLLILLTPIFPPVSPSFAPPLHSPPLSLATPLPSLPPPLATPTPFPPSLATPLPSPPLPPREVVCQEFRHGDTPEKFLIKVY